MAEKINNLEVSIGQLKNSKEKGMRDVVKEKERLQEEVTKAMHKVRVTINLRLFCKLLVLHQHYSKQCLMLKIMWQPHAFQRS